MAGSQDVLQNLLAYQQRTKAGLHALGEHYAAKMEADSKENASWVDRTSHARQGLFGYVQADSEKIKVRVAGSMEYNPYLELSNQGKFAILEPTAKKHAPKFFKDAERVVGGNAQSHLRSSNE